MEPCCLCKNWTTNRYQSFCRKRKAINALFVARLQTLQRITRRWLSMKKMKKLPCQVVRPENRSPKLFECFPPHPRRFCENCEHFQQTHHASHTHRCSETNQTGKETLAAKNGVDCFKTFRLASISERARRLSTGDALMEDDVFAQHILEVSNSDPAYSRRSSVYSSKRSTKIRVRLS